MQQHQIDNINARTCWETIGLRNGEIKVVLIVQTDLILDAEDVGFDAESYQELLANVTDYMITQRHIDTVAFYKMGDQ